MGTTPKGWVASLPHGPGSLAWSVLFPRMGRVGEPQDPRKGPVDARSGRCRNHGPVGDPQDPKRLRRARRRRSRRGRTGGGRLGPRREPGPPWGSQAVPKGPKAPRDVRFTPFGPFGTPSEGRSGSFFRPERRGSGLSAGWQRAPARRVVDRLGLVSTRSVLLAAPVGPSCKHGPPT